MNCIYTRAHSVCTTLGHPHDESSSVALRVPDRTLKKEHGDAMTRAALFTAIASLFTKSMLQNTIYKRHNVSPYL